MAMHSTSQHYGTVPIIVHWLTAVFVITLIILGFASASSTDDAFKAAMLSFHLPLGLAVLVLTVFRIAWWVLFDRMPEDPPGTPTLQAKIVFWSHIAFYVLLMLMTLSGVGLVALSGAADVIFGDVAGPLPVFSEFAPMIGHGLGAFAITALIIVHLGAVLFHQFVRKDGLLGRMTFGDQKERG